MESRSSFTELDRPAEENDIVDVNYDVLVDDQTQEELKAINYKFIISKEETFPELNQGVIGMKKNDIKDIPIVFKKDFYIEALKGKNGVLKVTLNKILKRQIPELTDEFVKSLGKFENVDAFKKNLNDGILQEKQMQEEDRIKVAILDEIQKDVSLELPEVLIKRETDRMIDEIKHQISHMNMEFDAYLNQIKKTEEDIRKDIRGDAEKKVLNALILREIIKLEKITVSPEEIHEKSQQIINDLSYQNPNVKDIDMETLNGYSEEIIKNEKVFKLLMSL
ncbi:MAG TPA: trigger factor [Candidatus Paceibacterota bacterium]|nr:trigger factor [Candidatus Paceibacterota bacterium]HRZ29275.1 trigger factor [Candidatus Paceibacterota bacterium]